MRIDHYAQSQLIFVSPDRLAQYWEVSLSRTSAGTCSMLIIATGFGSDIFLFESSDREFPNLKWPQGRVLVKGIDEKTKTRLYHYWSSTPIIFQLELSVDYESSRTTLAVFTSFESDQRVKSDI